MNRLRIIALAAIVFSLFSGSSVLATDSITFDSVWWNGLSANEQLIAVQGELDGQTEGMFDGQMRYSIYMNARSLRLERNASTLSQGVGLYEASQEYKPVFSNFGKTFGTYVHGVSDFYANHPEASRATVGEIIGCLADRPRQTCDHLAKLRSTQ